MILMPTHPHGLLGVGGVNVCYKFLAVSIWPVQWVNSLMIRIACALSLLAGCALPELKKPPLEPAVAADRSYSHADSAAHPMSEDEQIASIELGNFNDLEACQDCSGAFIWKGKKYVRRLGTAEVIGYTFKPIHRSEPPDHKSEQQLRAELH